MADHSPEAGVSSIAGRLARTRFATRATINFERLWPRVLPLLGVVGLYVSFAWFGLFRLLSDEARLAALAVFCLAAVGALWTLRGFRSATSAEVDARIEAANALPHTPLRVQSDRPVGDTDGFGQALWREHQRRMAAQLRGVGGDLPRTGVPERDPWGLRAAVALLLAVAFAFSFGPRGGSVQDGFRAVAMAEAVPPRIDAWVTPPAYTGKAPLFLTAQTNEGAQSFTVPEGSDVAVRVTGGTGMETLVFADAGGVERELTSDAPTQPAEGTPPPSTAPPAASAARQFGGKLGADGRLSLRSGTSTIATWSFAVTPDQAPTIRFTEDPKHAANGALELHYEIKDDYGAASATSQFALAEPSAADARPLFGPPEMPLALPRRGGNAAPLKASKDLTEHVWSGSTVNVTLSATDNAGHEARSKTKTFVLPERPFSNPLAKAVIELRKILSLDANRKPYVLQLIDAITLRPEDTISNPSHYLGLMAGRTRLQMAGSDEALRDVADYFWQMALQIENGNLSDAERKLRQAQEQLKQALRDGASDEEIDRLMKELRQAMSEYLKEFAERAQRDPNFAQQQPEQNGQEMRQSDLDRMMDQIENLAKSGNRDQAEQLLSQLQDMMNNLQARRQQQPGESGEQSEMRQQMNKLGEIMRRQQETMNETFRRDQMQRGQQQRGQDRSQQRGQDGEGQRDQQQGQNGENGQGQDMTPEEFAEALKQLQEGQGQLKGELQDLMKGLEGMGIQPGEGFGEAGEAMGEAEGALGDGNGGRAVGEQGRALEALRRGAQDMMQQMQQAMQGDEGGGEEGGRQQNADRDPLGRPRATTGPDFGDSVKVPDEIDVQRARQILEAIRKRLGNALSPDLERSYLERLLQMR
jgi:uncharacterized protein (TIGR02302 family)